MDSHGHHVPKPLLIVFSNNNIRFNEAVEPEILLQQEGHTSQMSDFV